MIAQVAHLYRASEASEIDYFKNYIWKVWTKNLNSSLKKGYFGVLIFQENAISKNNDPKKCQFSKKNHRRNYSHFND